MQEAKPPFVASAVCRSLAVAVRAQHAKVLDPMVVSDAVDVVDVHPNGRAVPFGQAARGTNLRKKPGGKQAEFDVASAASPGEQFIDWHRARTGLDFAPQARFVPRLCGKAEPLHAFAISVARVVITLDFGPVVDPPPVVAGGRPLSRPQAPHEFASSQSPHPRRVAEAEVSPALRKTMALIVEFLDRCPIVHPPHAHIIIEQTFECVAKMLPEGNQGTMIRQPARRV